MVLACLVSPNQKQNARIPITQILFFSQILYIDSLNGTADNFIFRSNVVVFSSCSVQSLTLLHGYMFNPVIFLCRPVQGLSKWRDPMAAPLACLPMAARLPALSDARAILRQMIGYHLLRPYDNRPKHWRASQHQTRFCESLIRFLNLQVIPASNKPSRSDS